MKKILIVVLAIVLTFAFCVPAFAADSNVTYSDQAQKFIFSPGSSSSPSDLFSDLKGVMPGDKITQQIVVKNNSGINKTVKIYLRSLGAQDKTNDFLKNMKLTVKENGQYTLYQAPADQTAQLTDRVCLGTFLPGAEVTLDVTLEVPIEMTSDQASKTGYIDWEFTAEEFENPQPVKTGDEVNLAVFIVIIAAAAAAIVIAVVVYNRKKKQNNQ